MGAYCLSFSGGHGTYWLANCRKSHFEWQDSNGIKWDALFSIVRAQTGDIKLAQEQLSHNCEEFRTQRKSAG
jgi:hypothetical protein